MDDAALLKQFPSNFDLLKVPQFTRLRDKDGDPWLVTVGGLTMFPDDPDRRYEWSFAEASGADEWHSPFTVTGAPQRVLVTGGRDFADRAALWNKLDELHAARYIALLIHGAARGADALAHDWAHERGVYVHECPADWKTHGKSAGFRRNQTMLDAEKPDIVVACPGGNGTADMVRRARAAGVPVVEVEPTPAVEF